MSIRGYFDYAATGPVMPEVRRVMAAFWEDEYGNPSSLHDLGQRAKMAMDKSREEIKELTGAERVVFTGGATEAINLGHKGLIENLKSEKKLIPHIITTQIEHKAVLESCRHLEDLGWARVTYLPVNKEGEITAGEVGAAVGEQTVLVSVMGVNNEVGSVMPLGDIGRMVTELNVVRARQGKARIYFHSDLTQWMGLYDVDMKRLGLDLASFSGHKIGAPKGIGALLVGKGGPKLVRQQDGGGQEGGWRGGTENIAFIVSLATVLKKRWQKKDEHRATIISRANYLSSKLLQTEGVVLNGSGGERQSHIVNIYVPKVEGEAVVMYLSDEGIAVSTGSACTSGDLKPSHVLLAMGMGAERAHGSIRWSVAEEKSEEEIDWAAEKLKEVVEKVRGMRKGIK